MSKSVQAQATAATVGLPTTPLLPRVRSARLQLRAALPGVPQHGPQPSPADAALFKAILDARPAVASAAEDADAAGWGYGRDGGKDTDGSDGMGAARIDPARCRGDRDSDAARASSHADAVGVPEVQALSDIVVRVCVQSHECGGRAVRVDLDNDVLPATQLSVYEDEGRLAVVFVSMHPGTHGRLCHGAAPIARRVAAELSRDVLLTVAAHGHEGRPLLEVSADAPAASGSTDGRGEPL
jgi:hypothetical protein